ncbi:hypothetical protein BD414DRAFT_525844 [Trametes punicea]|nr:hypothetical protein BD414DRAFT_525844 [Trametes punicea]
MRGAFRNSLKHLTPKSATRASRSLILHLLREQKEPLTIQELYNLAIQRQENQTQEGNSSKEPIIPSMRYLKKVVLPDLQTAGIIERVHTKKVLSQEQLEILKERMGQSSKKASTMSPSVQLWQWQLKSETTEDTAPEEKEVFGKEVGVGADWSHLNKRRQRAREEKVKRDVEWLKELDRARKDATTSS